MPAAAVIPASAASIKVAAVKRLAVECRTRVLEGGHVAFAHTLPCGGVQVVSLQASRLSSTRSLW